MKLILNDVYNNNDHISKSDVLKKLKEIFPNRDVEKVQQYPEITEIYLGEYMFLEDEAFVYRNESNNIIQMFPNIKLVVNLNKVLNVGNYCFYNCTKLKNSNEMFFCVKVGKYAFYKTNVKFKHFVGYIEIGEHAFDGCTGLTNLRTDILSPYLFANSSVKNVTLYDIKDIPEHCFDNCDVNIIHSTI